MRKVVQVGDRATPDDKVDSIYAFVGVEKHGGEGILAGQLGGGSLMGLFGGNLMPFVAGSEDGIKMFVERAYETAIAGSVELKLYRYSNRVDVTAELAPPPEPPKIDACERANELAKAAERPELCDRFAQYLVNKDGLSFRTLHRAYSIYAQLAENLEPSENGCRSTGDDRYWFSQRSK